jgi:hypothetical protein
MEFFSCEIQPSERKTSGNVTVTSLVPLLHAFPERKFINSCKDNCSHSFPEETIMSIMIVTTALAYWWLKAMQFKPESPFRVSHPFQLLNLQIKGYETGR